MLATSVTPSNEASTKDLGPIDINYITCFFVIIVLYRSISVNELFSAHLRTENPLKFGVLLILRTFLGASKSVC